MYVRLAFAVAAIWNPRSCWWTKFWPSVMPRFRRNASANGRGGPRGPHGVLRQPQYGRSPYALRGRDADRRRPTRAAGKARGDHLRYLSSALRGEGSGEGQIFWNGEQDAPKTEDLALRSIRLLNSHGVPHGTFEADKPITVEIGYQVLQRMRGARFSVWLFTQEGELAFTATDHLFQPESLEPGYYRTSCHIPGGLSTGVATSSLCNAISRGKGPSSRNGSISPSTSPAPEIRHRPFPEAWPGVLCPRIEWKVEAVTA